MKGLLITLTVALFAFRSQAPLVHRLIVLPQSKLTIEGKTNLNEFKCIIARYTGSDTLVLHEGIRNSRPVFVQGALGLNATSFDCGMALMTSDFQKTINSKVYPVITIDFISFEQMPKYTPEKEKFRGILKITLSGVTKLFEVPCYIEAQPSGVIHLAGTRDFTFSDFELKAPSRMLGALRVDNALTVIFQLELLLDPNS